MNYKKNIKIFISLSLVLTFSLSVFAQSIDRAEIRVKKLASQKLAGRGYVDNGLNYAANYIKKELVSIGVKPYKKSYFQEFKMSVNTFPSKMEVKINEELITPGIDYLVGKESPSVKGNFTLLHIDSITMNDTLKFIQFLEGKDISKSFAIIDLQQIKDKEVSSFYNNLLKSNKYKFAGYVKLNHNKLVWSPSRIQSNFPVVEILKSSFPKNATEIYVDIKSKYIKNYKAKNIIAYIEGENKDEFITLTAHYDHLGKMGKNTYMPGAYDNASGVAVLLDIAEYYSAYKPKYSLLFIFTSGEEAGLLGSEYYVKNPVFDLKKIKISLNFDIVGSGENGINVGNASLESYSKIKELIENIVIKKNLEIEIKPTGESKSSDHYPFHENGVPAISFSTSGNTPIFYHHVKDRPETLTYAKYNELVNLAKEIIKAF